MNYLIENLIQGTKEWFDYRRNKVTATDASCVMGVNPWCTEYQRWQEKLGLIPEPIVNERMIRGLQLEDKARNEFTQLTGIKMIPRVVTSVNNDWMGASLDGLSTCERYIVEIKCPGKNDHNEAQCGVIPEKYYPQLQHQLAVTGLDMAYYYSFDGTNGILLEIQRDQKYIENMIKKEKAFHDCLMQFKAPELSDKDYTQRDDDIWQHAAQKWNNTKNMLKLAENAEKEARDHLLSLCESKNCIGSGVKVQKITKIGSVNYSEIQELQNVDLEKYRKSSTEYWKIAEV